MTTVISDTSPINYLVLIEAVEILPQLFQEILIPPAVWRELQHPGTPRSVFEWAAKPPPWLKIESPLVIDETIQLGAGEIEAISLAVERKVPALLIDERRGWEAAKARGIVPIGTLNILESADRHGLLDFEEAVGRLRLTNFRVNPVLLEWVLERVRTQKQAD